MAFQPLSWLSLCVVVSALGLGHDFDADHLATIDGLTRFNLSARPELSRWCGALFAAGHGCFVLFAALVGDVPLTNGTSGWVGDVGAWIYLFVALLSFAVAGLRIAAYFNPQVDVLLEPCKLLVGLALVAGSALGLALIGLRSRPQAVIDEAATSAACQTGDSRSDLA